MVRANDEYSRKNMYRLLLLRTKKLRNVTQVIVAGLGVHPCNPYLRSKFMVNFEANRTLGPYATSVSGSAAARYL